MIVLTAATFGLNHGQEQRPLLTYTMERNSGHVLSIPWTEIVFTSHRTMQSLRPLLANTNDRAAIVGLYHGQG